jgi:hypothetical protein
MYWFQLPNNAQDMFLQISLSPYRRFFATDRELEVQESSGTGDDPP